MMPDDEKSCKEICIFLVSIYVEYWFNAARADKAPNQDILLIKELQKYSKIDSDISEADLKKFRTIYGISHQKLQQWRFLTMTCLFNTRTK